MENFGSRQTTLDLNGPTFTWLTEPTALEFCSAGVGTFIGIATATFPVQIPVNPAANDGYITYQWYVDGYGALTDGTIVSLGLTGITGSASTTLTVYGSSPTSHNKKFYIRPDYVPSAYAQPIGTTVTAGTARSTPNANNENFDSDLCNLTIYPTIGITSQPVGATLPVSIDTANFHIIDTISDTTQGDLTYQWTSNGVDLANGAGSLNAIVSGAQTKDLSLLSDTIGIQTIQCRILHPTSCDAPLYSDVVEYDAVTPGPIVKYEIIAEGSAQLRTTGEYNLESGGDDINLPGWSGAGIYYMSTGWNTNTWVSVNFNTNEESGIFHYINIEGINNFSENYGSGNINVAGGKMYRCTAPNGALHIGGDTPAGGGNRRLVVEEGGDDWNDMILNCGAGYFEYHSTDPQLAGSSKLRISYGDYTNGSVDPRNDIIIIYSPNKPIEANIKIAGAHGALNGNPGGPGGVSSFDLTLERGIEYVFALGAAGVKPSPGGGYGAGGGTFFYRGSELIACVGGGGGGGACGSGGSGGSISQNGSNGIGSRPGSGAAAPSDGSLPARGHFPGGSQTAYTPYGRTAHAMNGGRVSACTWGSWYINRAYSPCTDIGTSYFRGNDGTENTSTAKIMRSYKAGPKGGSGDGGNTGWIYRQNGGNGGWGSAVGYNGDGGGGARGGQGGHRSHSGGGGGSGYSNGEPSNITNYGNKNTGNSYLEIGLRS